MKDIMNMSIITSDPLISSLSHRQTKKGGPLPSEVVNLLNCSHKNNELNLQRDDTSGVACM